MSKFVVIVFPSDTAAYEARKALQELHAEASLTLFATAIVSRTASGTVRIDDADDAPVATAVGAFAGGLSGLMAGTAGVVGGPVGLVAGSSLGALFGGTADLYRLGINADFLRDVTDALAPGMTALLADVDEDWETPLDTRMQKLGGVVFRQWRADVEDTLWSREAAATRAEWEALKAEHQQAVGEHREKVRVRLAATEAKLADLKAKARARGEALKAEDAARLDQVKEQIHSAAQAAKLRIEARKAKQEEAVKAREALWDQMVEDLR